MPNFEYLKFVMSIYGDGGAHMCITSTLSDFFVMAYY